MKRKYKTLTAKQKSGKQRSIEEIAKELIHLQRLKETKEKEQHDDDDSAGMEYVQDMLDNF